MSGDPLDGSTVEVSVARVVRAHGVRGHLVVLALTDEPAERLTPGTLLQVENPRSGVPGTLAVVRALVRPDSIVLSVAEITDRDAAELLRGAVLTTRVPADRSPQDPEEFYDHQLVGLAVTDRSGAALGTVSAVDHHGAQDLLVVATGQGEQVLVPFVAALVPEVDPVRGLVVVDPPPGLFDAVPSEAVPSEAAPSDRAPGEDSP